MWLKRNLARAILALVLLSGGSVAMAAGPSQSGWTPLPDPAAGFVSAEQQTMPDHRALDRLIADFTIQIARSVAAEQQENDAACKASAAAHHGAVRSADWQASCRYRRY